LKGIFALQDKIYPILKILERFDLKINELLVKKKVKVKYRRDKSQWNIFILILLLQIANSHLPFRLISLDYLFDYLLLLFFVYFAYLNTVAAKYWYMLLP